MKKFILSCLVVSAFFTVVVFSLNESGNVMTKGASVLFDDPAIYEYANKNFSVSAMGVNEDEKVISVQITDSRYKEEVEEYFGKHIKKTDLSNYAIEVQIENEKF